MLLSSCAPVVKTASICALNRLNSSRVASGSSTIRMVPSTAPSAEPSPPTIRIASASIESRNGKPSTLTNDK